MDKPIKIGKPHGQKEKLVIRIRDILKRYSGEHCIFKEFIQNADDAGATEIAFILDSRQLGTNKTFGKDFNKLQGPSLLCWNNAVFTESDLEGIVDIGTGSKQGETAKIGRFGVGFNSVYHFTDAPQILSDNSDYLIFDPLCAYYPDMERTDPGRWIEDANSYFNQIDGIYSDVGSGFQVPFFELDKSTMFRLSLRQEPSGICSMTHSIENIRELIESFLQIDDTFLVFMKNITKVSFYELNIDGNLRLIRKKTKVFRNQNDKQKREEFHNQMSENMETKDTESISNVMYSVTIKTKSKVEKTCKDLLVFEQFGFETKTKEEKDLVNRLNEYSRNHEKNFPFGGIAIDLAYFTDPNFVNNSKLFSFLPLDQTSPLVPQINAYWSLHQENRQKIYEHSMRSEKVDKETAKCFTNWNLSIINHIILPLFIQLLEYLKQNYTSLNILINQFINRYLCLFPNLRENELKPYFEQMANSFYQQVKELELIPVLNHNNNLQWFKPSQLLFTRDFDSFLYLNKYNDLEASIYEIIENIGINLCRENSLIDLFYKHSRIDLLSLKPNHITDRLKALSSQLVDNRVDQTLLKSIKHVKCLLEYIYNSASNAFTSLENAPLVVKQNLELAKFSSSNKIIIYQEPKLFVDHKNLFLHECFYVLIRKQMDHELFFRHISIQDLMFLLPYILDPKIYLNNDTHVKYDQKKEVNKVWQIISKCIDENNTNKHVLEPIKNWSLIPVVETSSSETVLAPIKDADIILSRHNGFIFNVLRQIGFPQLDTSSIPNDSSKTRNIFASIVVSLSKNEDLLHFLDRQKHRYSTIFHDKYNRIQMLQHLEASIYREPYNYNRLLFSQNSISWSKVQRILKNLRIYEDIYERDDDLAKYNEIYLIDRKQIPTVIQEKLFEKSQSSFFYECFIDFINHENRDKKLFIMYKDDKYTRLFEYLQIREIGINQLYARFFKWAKEHNQDNLNDVLKDLVFLAKDIPNIYKLPSELLNTMKDLPFIKISDEFKRANECYDNTNALFEFIYPEKLLPLEYQTEEWRDHLRQLDFNVSCSPDDCKSIANKLAISHDLEFKERFRLSKLLLTEVNEIGDSSLIDEIKDKCFLPSELIIRQNVDTVLNVLEKIYKSHDQRINDIKKEFTNIIEIPSMKRIFCEFFTLVKLLIFDNKNNLLNELENAEIEILEAILSEYYEIFYRVLKENHQSPIISALDSIKMVLVRNKYGGDLLFVEPRLLVKNMSQNDQIDSHLYKLPFKYAKYWDLFKLLGSIEEICYEKCKEILDEYYTEFKDQPLESELYDNVLIVAKLLLFNKLILDANEDDYKRLYLPNMLHKMRPISSLYYMDDIGNEKFFKKSVQVCEICLFDEKDLARVIERSINDRSRNDETQEPPMKRNRVKYINIDELMNISWATFQKLYLYELRPISEIIRKDISDMDSLLLDNRLMQNKTKGLNSTELCESLIDLIKILDESFESERIENKKSVEEALQSIETYINLKEIRTCYRNKLTGEVIANSEQEEKYFWVKDDNKMIFIVKKENRNSNEYYIFLSEVVLEALKSKLTNLKELKCDSKLIGFMFALIKLLKCHSNTRSNNRAIISDYKSTFA